MGENTVSKINPGLYNSEDHTWQTPPGLIEAILKFERQACFDLDAATSTLNIPASFHFTPDGLFNIHGGKIKGLGGCGLTGDWKIFKDNLVWLNPPYGALLKKFIQKAYEEFQKGCRVWVLVPVRTETQYQHDYGLTKAGFTVFLKGRLHFLQNGEDKGPAPFPTMLCYYGDDWQEKAERWVKKQPLPGTLMTEMKGEISDGLARKFWLPEVKRIHENSQKKK